MMGRASKFSFPMPGQSRSPPPPGHSDVRPVPALQLSKAQRILGMDSGLNIDAPKKEDYSYMLATRPPSSSMSIVLSDATQDDDEKSLFDGDSAILPRSDEVPATSSTSAGRKSNHGLGPGNPGQRGSNLERTMPHKNAEFSSISNYKRQNGPTAVPQQRPQLHSSKGHNVKANDDHLQRSSLRSKIQDYHANLVMPKSENPRPYGPSYSNAEKKPNKLDLSRLFGRSKRDTWNSPGRGDDNTIKSQLEQPQPKRLTKGPPKSAGNDRAVLSLPQLPDISALPTLQNGSLSSFDYSSDRSTNNHAHNSTEVSRRKLSGYEPVPSAAFHSSSISSYNGDMSNALPPDQYLKSMRAGMTQPTYDRQSVTSSRRTLNSVFSDSNLRKESVLTVSSGDESDDQNAQASSIRSQRRRGSPSVASVKTRSSMMLFPTDSIVDKHGRQASLSALGPPAQLSVKKSQRIANQPRESEPSVPSVVAKSRLPSQTGSEVQNLGDESTDNSQSDTTSATYTRTMKVTQQEAVFLAALRQKRKEMRRQVLAEEKKELHPPRKHSVGSLASVKTTASLPVRSSTTIVLRNNGSKPGEPASTFRPTQIQEEYQPKAIHRQHLHAQSSDLKFRTRMSSSKYTSSDSPSEQILLYLDQPAEAAQDINTSEPSPDLTDFLTYGGDASCAEEDVSAGEVDWARPVNVRDLASAKVRAGRPRPDSMVRPSHAMGHHTTQATGRQPTREEDDVLEVLEDGWPPTPRSIPRLSAVGGLASPVSESEWVAGRMIRTRGSQI